VSWIDLDGNVYVLQDSDLDTKEGRRLLNSSVISDIDGHGALQNYYPELRGRGWHREYENFDNPLGFPKTIHELLQQGKLARIAALSKNLRSMAAGMLTRKACDKLKPAYDKATDLPGRELFAVAFKQIIKNKRNLKLIWRGTQMEMVRKGGSVGSYVLVKKPKSLKGRKTRPSWVNEMDEYDGKVVRINDITREGFYSCTPRSWKFHKKWCTNVTEDGTPIRKAKAKSRR